MKFSNNQKQNAIEYLNKLLSANVNFEIKKLSDKRTLSQNRYFHLLLKFFSIEFGYEFEYTKQIIFKREVNKDLFYSEIINKNNGDIQVFYKSSSSLDTKQMTIAIDRFKNYSAKYGLVLPESEDYNFINYIENNIERYAEFL